MRGRNVISNERIENKGKSVIDYVIEIENFNLTMINVEAGVMISSKKFLVNWSEFSVAVKKGDLQREGKLSVFLTNHSDWMVRANCSLSVEHSSLYRSSEEKVWKARAERFCGKIPFSRCTITDLLTPDGSLKIRVRVELHAENFPGGTHDNEYHLETRLANVQAKLLQVEAKAYGGIQVDVVEETPREGTRQVKCPVCLKDVVKPMRLQQCPQGHIICDDCYGHINQSGSENRKLCVTCKSQYCGRPAVLEELLQLQDNSEEDAIIVID